MDKRHHQYRMVAYRGDSFGGITAAMKQELLLIRAQDTWPDGKQGDDMLKEVKEMLAELHLVDSEGKVARQSDLERQGVQVKTRAQYFGDMVLDSLEIKLPEEAMFLELSDIKYAPDAENPNGSSCMSIDGLHKALQVLHVDKKDLNIDVAFKVADLNGDGEIDLDEFLFAVKIRHGSGFEKGQYFITWKSLQPIDPIQCRQLIGLFGGLKRPLSASGIEELTPFQPLFGRTNSVKSHLSFKGKTTHSYHVHTHTHDRMWTHTHTHTSGGPFVCTRPD